LKINHGLKRGSRCRQRVERKGVGGVGVEFGSSVRVYLVVMF